jgi:hypothetical protein
MKRVFGSLRRLSDQWQAALLKIGNSANFIRIAAATSDPLVHWADVASRPALRAAQT